MFLYIHMIGFKQVETYTVYYIWKDLCQDNIGSLSCLGLGSETEAVCLRVSKIPSTMGDREQSLLQVPVSPYVFQDTPWKNYMEPENQTIEKENRLPNLHFWVPC